MTRRAIIMVPGISRREQLATRDQLVESIYYYSEGYATVTSDSKESSGFNYRTVTATSLEENGEEVTLDVYEAFWGDLVPDWSKESPWQRFKHGLTLITYWALGGLARSIARREIPPRTSFAMVIAGLILIFWYLTVVTVLAKAIADGNSGMPDFINTYFVENETGIWLLAKVKSLGAWPIFTFALLVLGMGRVESFANIAAFLKAYFRDDPINGSNVGLRAKSRKRVISVLNHVHQVAGEADSADRYDEVFVVAHSLGGAIAVDALAEYGANLATTTLITRGSSLGALVQQEPLIQHEIAKFYISKTRISNWTDIVFTMDMMGSKVPIPRLSETGWSPKKHPPIFPPTQIPPLPKGQGFRMALIHEAYYRSERAILMLVRPVVSQPQPKVPAPNP